ncbi:MAG: molybdopterin-dependent oxidoreductase [Bacteriovorax sp.]|nr:molybdopterin-dependent oxidoreductase [Rhizobacter sp.]
MNGLENDRWQWRVRSAAVAVVWACAALSPLSAEALDRPAGKVILTVTGTLSVRNEAEAAVFDLALLDQLPQHSFSTKTPWYPEARKFSGVLVSDLLKAVGVQGTTLKAVALNDYRVEIPVEDLVRHGAMIASQLDGKPIAVRDKGPLLIIYPFDDRPELRTAVHYSRAIWQLKGLEFR